MTIVQVISTIAIGGYVQGGFPMNNRIVLQLNYNRDYNELVEFSIWPEHTSGTLGTGQVNPGVR